MINQKEVEEIKALKGEKGMTIMYSVFSIVGASLALPSGNLYLTSGTLEIWVMYIMIILIINVSGYGIWYAQRTKKSREKALEQIVKEGAD